MNSLLSDLSTAADILSSVQQFESEIQKLHQDLNDYHRTMRAKKTESEDTKRHFLTAVFVVIPVLFLSFLLAAFTSIMGIVIICAIICGIILLYFGIKYDHCKENESKNRIVAQSQINQSEARINELQKMKEQMLLQKKQALSFLPEVYRNFSAVSFMRQAVQNLRADTLKEAINLYEAELYRVQLDAQRERDRDKADANARLIQLEIRQLGSDIAYELDKERNKFN
jgi:hypothetical protein